MRDCVGKKHNNRSGFTVLELLTTIAIIGILLALILPAIASSRASARRIQCQNNLHQMGLALHRVVESHGAFPTAESTSVFATTDSARGLHERLLPALEQEQALAHSKKYRGARVSVYLCPDDSLADAATSGAIATYYRKNIGVGFRAQFPRTGFDIGDEADVRPADITDGLSNTVAISERLWFYRDSGSSIVDPGDPRVFWWTTQRFYGVDEIPQAIDQARNHRVTPSPQSVVVGYLTYDHMLPPNHPASYNGPDAPGADGDHLLVPASSFHRGLVNSLLADGSCRVMSDSVDLAVWHALGTRAGGETNAQ